MKAKVLNGFVSENLSASIGEEIEINDSDQFNNLVENGFIEEVTTAPLRATRKGTRNMINDPNNPNTTTTGDTVQPVTQPNTVVTPNPLDPATPIDPTTTQPEQKGITGEF